jgi:putative aminopeptidase FrvX
VIANKSHHATTPEEKYRVVPYQEQIVDAGFANAEAAKSAGVRVGTPIVYAPKFVELAGDRVAGTSIDDRAGCAIMIAAAKALMANRRRPTLHLVFSVQEEFNLRGAAPAARALAPDIAIQLDIILATDTPDMEARGDVRLGAGPGMGVFSFHGRGTLNGTIPHPSLVTLFERVATREGLSVQRSAHIGALTDSAYVQLEGPGIAAIDLGFPTRYTHSSLEVCDLSDLEGLARLVVAGIMGVDAKFRLSRED